MTKIEYIEKGYTSCGAMSDGTELLMKEDKINEQEIYWYVVIDKYANATTPTPMIMSQKIVEMLYNSNHF